MRSALFRKVILGLQAARREHLERSGQPAPVSSTGSDWDRRRFVRTAATAGIAGLCSNFVSLPAAAFERRADPARIAIIGAGLAGLNAAWQLKKRAGIEATIYEAQNRVGGRVRSVEGAVGTDLITDLGAELINTDHADMLGLVGDFHIELFNRLADAGTATDDAGNSVPKEAFFFDGRSYGEAELANDLLALATQIADDAALLDQNWDRHARRLDRMSVKDYLDLHADKIPSAYVRRLLESAVRTEYGAEPGESSSLQLIFVLPTVDGQAVDLLSYSDEQYGVVGGTARITDALGEALQDQIRLRMPLQELTRSGDSYRLSFADRSTADADIVIVAVPFTVLRGVRLGIPLPDPLRSFINEAQLGSNEKLIAGFDERFWRRQGAFSLAAWGDFPFSEVWDETQRQSTRTDGALNFFLGGDAARRLGAIRDPAALGRSFVAALDRHVEGASEASTGRFVKTAWQRNPYSLGAYANFRPGQLTRFGGFFWVDSDDPAERQAVAAGRVLFIGEHLSDAYYGFMNGAAETGRLAAELLLARITANQL